MDRKVSSTAAENVSNKEVRGLFNECSLQRAKFAGELQSASHELGDSHPEYASSVSGTVHRGWINLKSLVSNGDPRAILLECERGENCAIAEYERVLKLEIPANLRDTISHQYAAILEAQGQVKALADAAAPTWA